MATQSGGRGLTTGCGVRTGKRSVSRSGRRVQVDARFARVSDDVPVPGVEYTFDRDVRDLAGVLGDISTAIVNEMRSIARTRSAAVQSRSGCVLSVSQGQRVSREAKSRELGQGRSPLRAGRLRTSHLRSGLGWAGKRTCGALASIHRGGDYSTGSANGSGCAQSHPSSIRCWPRRTPRSLTGTRTNAIGSTRGCRS